MIFRKVAKCVVAALAVAFLIETGGSSAIAQEYYGFESYPSSYASSIPVVDSGVTYPTEQVVYSSPVVESLPTTSSFVDPTVTGAAYSSPVSPTYETYPAATYATGNQGFSASVYSQPAGTFTSSPSYQSAGSTSPRTVSTGLAQSKAQQAASSGIRGHIGGGLGGARYEGVGWSNQSAQAAIEHCCYWGTRPTAQIGVSRGSDGLWYACVLYH